MFWCTGESAAKDSPVKLEKGEQDVAARLDRLDLWMQSVDDRLTALVDYHSSNPRKASRMSVAWDADTLRGSLGSRMSTVLEEKDRERISTDISDGFFDSYDGFETKDTWDETFGVRETFEARKQASRRLMTQAFWNKCESVSKGGQAPRYGHLFMAKVVTSKYFDYFISIMLAINALLIGLDVEWRAQGLRENPILEALEWFCASVFAIELVLRVAFTPELFCQAHNRAWAAWDVILVGISIVDLVLVFLPGGSDSPVASLGATGRLLKIMRMLRILRVLRMVRFLSELRVMTNMIQKSLKSLFWLFSLLALLIYVFSVVLTQGTTEFLMTTYVSPQSPDFPYYNVVKEYYGSIPHTMYTLFQAMCGGVSWGEVTTPLQIVAWPYFGISLVYIFFSIFSVFNIVTGVFVDGAIEFAKQDRSMLTAKKALSREASALALVELLKEMDTDCNNILTETELRASLLRTDVQEYLDALSVDTTEAKMLFTLLDEDGNGEVDIEEFVTGMQRLQGEAKNFDVHLLIHTNRQLLRRCANLMETLAAEELGKMACMTPQLVSPQSRPSVRGSNVVDAMF